jgi:hypothetical protein
MITKSSMANYKVRMNKGRETKCTQVKVKGKDIPVTGRGGP